MTIFAPVDTMGPAHRSGQIQQMAQAAAQNVMRRQKLRAMLQNTTGAAQGHAGGNSVGASQPIRGSFMGHSTGVRGATFRPGAGGTLGGLQAGMVQGGGLGNANANFPDPGPVDLPSLPYQADPGQSPSSAQPGPVNDPANAQPMGYAPSSGPTTTGTPIGSTALTTYGTSAPGSDAVIVANHGSIPLGGGLFYNPATDTIHGGGGSALGA